MARMAQGIELAALMTKIELDIDAFMKDMDKAADAGVEGAERISEKMTRSIKAGETLSKVGDKLTKGLTLPITAAATATTKMAVDFESSFAKVSTLLDENVVDYGNYKEELLDASNETKIAVDEFSEAVYQSISAGVDQQKAINFTTEAMKLAKGGFTDGASAVDILTTAINGYTLSADDATRISDMLITTQNLGKTTVNELAASMGAVIPVANSVNFGIEELSASYAQLTKNGIATAESGTYLKSMLSELGKSGSIADKTLRELTGKGFTDLKNEGTATTEIIRMLDEEAKKNDKSLKDMFGSVEAGTAALVLYKGAGTEYNEMLQAMGTSAGATEEAFNKIDSTPAEQLKGALNELRNEGVKLGASFVPVITKVADSVGNAAEKFSKLSDEQKENVLKWAGVAAAAGPALNVFGKGVTTISKVSDLLSKTSKTIGAAGSSTGLIGSFGGLGTVCVPLVAGMTAASVGAYALHENAQLMNRTIIDSTEELSGMEKVLANMQGVETKSREELEKLGYVHKEFSGDISDEFQKAVETSTEKVQEFSVFLQEIGFDNVISSEESSEFVSRVSDMCQSAIQVIQSKKEESQKALKELFVADDNTIDESEKKTLEILSKTNNDRIKEVQRCEGEMLKIMQNAQSQKRSLNEQEIDQLNSYSERISTLQIEAQASTQDEMLYAQNEFNARIKNMDLKSASELLQEKAKTRDDELVQIQAQYDTQIDMLKANLEKCTGEEKKALEEQIKNLESDKEKKIQAQEDLWNKYLEIVKENNPKMLEEINEYNGKILTNQEKESKKQLENMKARYDGLDQITKSGWYQVYDTQKKFLDNISVVVDEKTGDIVAIHSDGLGKVGAAWKEAGKAAEKMASDEDAAFQRIIGSHMKYNASTNSVVDAATNIEYAMKEVTTAADGTRQGIIDLNGTPCKVTVDKQGAITALNQIDSTANNAARDRTLTIKVRSIGSEEYFNYTPNVRTRAPFSSNFNGIDNVPYDGYRARLHKGERILTAEENKAYSAGSAVDYGAIQSIVRKELSGIMIQINGREFGRAVRSVK